jgi:CRISPR-associated protein Cas5, N-terminal domain
MAYIIQIEIAGDTAMWTRPDTGDSPVSYPAPTYSAVKAIFESILWGPAVEIIPIKTEICTPIQFHSYYTNYGGPNRKATNIKKGTVYQWNATVLVDVCYRLYAEAVPFREKEKLPQKAKAWDRATTSPGHAYQDMFNRRLTRGQCYSIPSLGWREFTPSYFGAFRDHTRIMKELPSINIPSMLRQVFSKGYNSEVRYEFDTDVEIVNGVLLYQREKTP